MWSVGAHGAAGAPTAARDLSDHPLAATPARPPRTLHPNPRPTTTPAGSTLRCPNACGSQTSTPNNNVEADGMASVIAHEIARARPFGGLAGLGGGLDGHWGPGLLGPLRGGGGTCRRATLCTALLPLWLGRRAACVGFQAVPCTRGCQYFARRLRPPTPVRHPVPPFQTEAITDPLLNAWYDSRG